MAREIDLCIPYIGQGFKYLDYLSKNAKKLADNPDNVHLRVSFHTVEDRKLLEPIQSRFASISQAKTYEGQPGMLFWPSANHSAAMNAMAKECTGDVSVFCDYDMVFLRHGWDTELLELKSDLAGVPYQPYMLSPPNAWVKKNMPYLQYAAKYQRLPNLSFMAIKKKTLEEVFDRVLTRFDKFLEQGGIPFRIVNAQKIGVANNLPAGCIQWLDTGAEIPEIILENDLSYTLLDHFPANILKQVPEDIGALMSPEVFELHGKPFVAHYKKGSKKAKQVHAYTWEQFIEDCECAISTLNSTTGVDGQGPESPSIVLAG